MPGVMTVRRIADPIASTTEHAGRGMLAGVAATAVMTASTALEMKLRDREASSVPAKAAGKVLGVQPRNQEGAARFGNYVHWSYGTGWGVVGGVMRTAIPEPYASVAHFASVWGAEVSMLPAMDLAPPLTEWGVKEIAIDVLHHLVYAGAFAAAWWLLGTSR